MKVKIINSSRSSYWYFDKIGEMYDVYDENSEWYGLVKDKSIYEKRCINKKDCKIVNKGELNMNNQTEKITFEKSKYTLKQMGIKKVVFNNPVVVVQLNDGRKGVAKCGEQDTYDEEVGFAVAFTQAVMSEKVVNKSNFKRHIDNLAFRKSKKKKDCVVIEVA